MIYLASQNAFQRRSQNAIETFNELMILMVTYNYVVFIDPTIDGAGKYNFGWTYILAILFGVLVNLIVLAKIGVVPELPIWKNKIKRFYSKTKRLLDERQILLKLKS